MDRLWFGFSPPKIYYFPPGGFSPKKGRTAGHNGGKGIGPPEKRGAPAMSEKRGLRTKMCGGEKKKRKILETGGKGE